VHAGAVGAQLLALLDGAQQGFVQPIATADHVQANGLIDAAASFCEEIAA
jgi:hypothetical protein